MRRPSHPLLTLSLLCLLLLGLAMPALSAQPEAKVTLRAEAGYDGLAKDGRWIPVKVTLTNEGRELEGRLQFETRVDFGESFVQGKRTYSVLLPAGATKQVELLMPTHLGYNPQIELVVGEERVATVRPGLQVTPDVLIGVLGVEPAEVGGLSGMRFGQRASRLVQLTPERIPTEPLALGSLDLVLLDRFAWAELPAAQQVALQAWVEHGGLLLIAGGPEFGRAEPLFPWIGLEALGVESVDLTGIGSATLLRFAEQGWQVTDRIGGQPIAAMRPKGSGAIHLLAFDPALEPFASWAGLRPLLERVLMMHHALGTGLAESQVFAAQSLTVDDPMGLLPVGEIPAAKPLLYLLGLYALLIGPVHLLLLKTFRRVGIALITLPLLSLAGAGTAWAHLQANRGAEVNAYGYGLVEGQPGGSSLLVHTFQGFYPPPGASYEVEVGGGLLVSYPSMPVDTAPMLPVALQGSDPVRAGRSIHMRSLESWHMRGIGAQAVLPVAGTVAGDLIVDGSIITGIVTNHLPFAVREAILVVGNQFKWVGDLAPGQSADVAMRLQGLDFQRFGNPFSETLAQAFRFDRFAPQDPTPAEWVRMRREYATWRLSQALPWASWTAKPQVALAGWLDESPLPVTIDGQRQEPSGVTLYVQRMAYAMTDQEFVLPNHFIPSTVIENDGVNLYGTQVSLFNELGSVTTQHTIPANLIDRVTGIELRVPTDERMGGPVRTTFQLDLFRWVDATWVEQEYESQALQLDPAHFMGPDGQVWSRLRLDNESYNWGVYLPVITVTGRAMTP